MLWDETEGRRGGNEIGTCIYIYLQSLPPAVQNVTFYSDNCGGQNKNRYFATALIYALQQSKHITSIDHKFLETGHTNMEVDSIHAAVEHAKKNVKVFVPTDWQTVCSCARRRKPYTVVSLLHDQFVDFKEMSKSLHHLKCISWQSCVWVKYLKVQYEDGSKVEVASSETFDGPFTAAQPKKTRKAFQTTSNIQPIPLYTSRLPISNSKKNDLMTLCTNGTIPSHYHTFYSDLPTHTDIEDRIPVPDEDESEDD